MSDNVIYEITQMMHDRTNVQSDMEEAFNMVSEMFRKKYVSKMHKAIQSQQLQTKKDPPKEAQLLSAMKAFAREETHPMYDRMIDMLLTADTLQKMSGRIKPVTVQETSQNSVHHDGIYDIDNVCVASRGKSGTNLAGMLMMMSLFSGKR